MDGRPTREAFRGRPRRDRATANASAQAIAPGEVEEGEWHRVAQLRALGDQISVTLTTVIQTAPGAQHDDHEGHRGEGEGAMSRVRSTPARAAALALAMLALLFAGPAAHVAHGEPNGGAAKGCALPDGTKAAPGDDKTVVTIPLRGGKLFGFVVVSIFGEDGRWHPVDTTDLRTVGAVATVQWGATAGA